MYIPTRKVCSCTIIRLNAIVYYLLLSSRVKDKGIRKICEDTRNYLYAQLAHMKMQTSLRPLHTIVEYEDL